MMYAALAVAFVSVVAWDAWRRWLAKTHASHAELVAAAHKTNLDLDTACALWGTKLDAVLKRIDQLERVVERIEPGQKFNPLGKHYNPRS